ncbi:MAG: SMC-Scp complex subunit ScpB [Thermovirgaceae bacterium]
MLSITAQSIEALLFVTTEPVSEKELASVLSREASEITAAINELIEHYNDHHGLRLIQIGSGWEMVTSDNMTDILASFRDTCQKQCLRLSKAALETLAVVAYAQPVTRAEIEEIRGVRCDRVLETLLSHGLVRVAGRKPGTGTPLLYRTTDTFLERFGLNSISDLPTLDEISDMAAEMETRGIDSEDNGE